MVIYKRLSGLLWFSLGIFLLFSPSTAEKSTHYLNLLSPIYGWRLAYGCILNETNPCQAKYTLNMSGIVVVPQQEVAVYCRSDCAEHNRAVLKCIHQMKRDFWFSNKAPVHFINDSINHGCSTTTEINTTSYSSASSMRLYKSVSVTLMSVSFLIIFNI